MARRVDRLDPREPEVPDEVGIDERRQEAAARAVNVDRHVEAGLRLQRVEGVGDRLHGLVVAGERDAEGGHDADGVLVDPLEDLLGVHDQAVALHRDLAVLDAPVARELVPADLDRSGDEVRLVVGPPRRALPGTPVPEQGHPAEHGGLARARRRRPERVRGIRRVPQVGQDVHAARLELGRLRVLVLVDHVLVERQVHQPMDLGLEPRLAERREVLARVAVEHQLVRHDLVGVPRILLPLGDPVLGHRHRQVVRCEHVILQRVADGVPGVQHRGSPWRLAGSPTWWGTGTGTRAGPERRSRAAPEAPGGPPAPRS